MRYYLLGLLILLGLVSQSQSNWKFNHITTDEGLSTGTVNCIFKDSKGYIWIGTQDGLNRYDGYDITVFKNEKNDPKSLSGNIITAITEDIEGNIWVGTRASGINIFDWKTEQFTPFNELVTKDIQTGQIRALHLTHNNELLIGSEAGGIILYNPETDSIKQYLSEPGNLTSISNNTVLFVVKASKSRYWVSSLSTSIDLFNIETGSFEHFAYDPSFEPVENNRKTLLQDSNGILWIGTDGKGLIQYNTESKQMKLYTDQNSGLMSNIITTIYEDDQGLLYIGTDGEGINILDPTTESFSYLQSNLLDPTSLTSDAIYQIYEDDSGIVWVSTFRGGVNTYSPNRLKFDLYQQIPFETNSLSFGSVIEVLETADGYVWIGTDGGGLDQLNPITGEFDHFKHDPDDPFSISTNVTISLLEDDEGYLWVGTYSGGVNRLDRNTGSFKRFLPDPNDPTSINSKNVWHILQDSQGTIWFGLLNGGLDKYDPMTESFTHHIPSNQKGSISSNVIVTMLEDSKSNFWIGTENSGLDLFDRASGSFTNFGHIDGDSTTILNNNVRTLFEDSNGQLWIGTSEGANVMNLQDKSIRKASVNKLLPNPVINGIQEDDQSNLWIATNKGISKYNTQNHTLISFTKSDGLQGNEFNYTTSTKTQDGTMYFGGVKGLNVFRPSDVRMSTFEPKVVITDIKLFGESIAEMVNEKGEKLVNETPQTLKKLQLQHDQNVIEITFASLDYTSPHSNKYRYKLEGFDGDWIYKDAGKRSANYTNLDPDTYNFYLEGTNSDGIWSSHGNMLIIEVLPPWWFTWWFKTFVLVMTTTGIFLFVRWRTNNHRKQKEVLNEKIAAATDQVYAQNEELIKEQDNLREAIEETNEVIKKAVESGDFSARINLENKKGEWRKLGESINNFFNSIVLPFALMNEVVNSLAENDLTQRYKHQAKGDIKRVTDNLNQSIKKLAELLIMVKDNTKEIGQASNEMLASSQEMTVGTGEIASSTSELSNGAQEQVSRIDEASHTLESILKFSSTMGEQAKSIHQAAEKGVNISEDGQVQMNQLDQGMIKMQGVSKNTKKSITKLRVQSSEISSILNSIKEISVETNMLALNAAIEAAKAGDAGRGFAVVADQIRKLAENSSDFAREIETIISEVQGSINSTGKLMHEMSEDIEDSVEASKTASLSFTDLASSYSQTLDLSKQIVSYTDQQFVKIRQVVQLMESVVVIAEEAAAGTEEIASSSNQLSAGMTEYAEKTKKVSNIIQSLTEKMDRFKLEK